MANVLFFGMPSHGHINPTLGLVAELIKRGEQVVYFASPEFKDKLEAAGAIVKFYSEDLNIFQVKPGARTGGILGSMHNLIRNSSEIIADILTQVEGIKFDYIIHSAAFPFARPLVQITKLPAVSSLAVFAGIRNFTPERFKILPGSEEFIATYRAAAAKLEQTYGIQMPEHPLELLINKAGLNLVYTSQYFAPDPDFFDHTYKFVGPPVYEQSASTGFPFDQIAGKKVLYISLGTVFGNFSMKLYGLFFEAFESWDGVVVLAAHKVDLSAYSIPANFMVRDYVPQWALLKHTAAAITHAGMNSISDLISAQTPFVCLPLGADQPLLAKRAEELGATISLDVETLTASALRAAVQQVLDEPSYLENIRKIDRSFREAGGYPKAVDEIFEFVGR